MQVVLAAPAVLHHNLTLSGPVGLPWLPKRLSAYLLRACVFLARGVARVVMLLPFSLSTACTSLVLGDPLGARASHHHQAKVKPYCCELTLVVRRRCRCSCRNLASDVAAAERSDCAARAVDDSWRPIVERLARDSFASTVGMPCNARRKVRPPCRSP